MRVAVTSEGAGLEALADPRFGRCRYFVIVDTGTQEAETVENVATSEGHGAGVRAVRLLAEHDADVIVTGRCGPNAFRALQASKIAVYTTAAGTVGECVQRLVGNELTQSDSPSAESHSGLQNSPST